MPWRDIYHETVKTALVKDGWTITHDPFFYAQYQPANGNIDVKTIFDEEHDHYQLFYIGWNRATRIHACILHIEIECDGDDCKVWLQHDGIEHGIAEELVEAGVPRDHIVLGFKPPEVRQYIDYAVA